MHDRNGKPLEVGDTVTLTGKITTTYPGATACNIVVEPETSPGHGLTLNAQDVAKVEPTE